MKYFSKSKNAFYARELRRNYESAKNWPADAIEVAEEVYREFSGQPPSGYRRDADADGLPVWVEVPPEPRSTRVEQAKADIDRAAGAARLRFVSPGDLVEQEYREAESAAKKWQDAGEPADAIPNEVQVWADAASMTPSAAAQDIVQTGQAWRDVLAHARALRLQGKAAIDAAADADIESTARGYIDQLDAMAPA